MTKTELNMLYQLLEIFEKNICCKEQNCNNCRCFLDNECFCSLDKIKWELEKRLDK